MEKLDLKSLSSQAKIMGTILSISGAFVVTLYKGPAIVVAHRSAKPLLHNFGSSLSNWVLGSIFLTAKYLLVPVWYIIQAQIMNEYPSELTVVFYHNLCEAIIAVIVGLIAEANLSIWNGGLNIELVSMLCSGIFDKVMKLALHSWALRLKGPMYVAMFMPLSIIIAAAMGVIFLGDIFHLGSVIGGTMISVGFYTVIWAKTKEEMGHDSGRSSDGQPTHRSPLLPSHKVQKT